MEVEEGGVKITVEDPATEGRTDDVFYNPRQELNRDLTIAVLRALRSSQPGVETYLDAMTATGIRGLRAAADGWTVTCCDRDPAAIGRARSHFEANGFEAEFVTRNVNALVHERGFDVIDLDPFGSPMPFVDAAVSRSPRLLCVTATDTAPLCGAHLRAGMRRYFAVPRNTEYHREMGLRTLLAGVCRLAAMRDLAIEPVCTHATSHYVRAYCRLSGGAGTADAAIDQLGVIAHCEDCLYRESAAGLLGTIFETCPNCDGDRVLHAGPIWIGPTRDRAFLRTVCDALDDAMGERDAAADLIEQLIDELDRPTHYDQHVLCKRWNRSAPAMDAFLDRLDAAGFETSRTHFGGTTFKTDAGVEQIRRATECAR